VTYHKIDHGFLFLSALSFVNNLQFLFPYPGESKNISSCDNQTLFLFLLVAVTFAIMSDNDTGIRGVPGVHRPGAKLAIISVIV